MMEKGRNDEGRMTNDEGNVMKISCWLPSKGECGDGEVA